MSSHTEENNQNQRDVFLSIVSHELKTPITTIQGFTQAMQRKIQQKIQNYKRNALFSKEELEKHSENFDTILKQIKRMNRLIDDLLDVSVIEKGTLSYTFATVNIFQVLKDVVERMQQYSPNHRIRLQSSITNPSWVMGDESKLDQLISNILSNAIKFSVASDSISVNFEEEDYNYRIDIQDSGIGIPESELPNVFDLYYRGKEVGSRKLSGLGLGLYLSKKIIEMHNGSIIIESRVNVGTTVTMRFPKYNHEKNILAQVF